MFFYRPDLLTPEWIVSPTATETARRVDSSHTMMKYKYKSTSIRIETVSANCSALFLAEFMLHNTRQDKQDLDLLLKRAENFARDAGYSFLYYSINETQKRLFGDIFKNNDFVRMSKMYKNKRTLSKMYWGYKQI